MKAARLPARRAAFCTRFSICGGTRTVPPKGSAPAAGKAKGGWRPLRGLIRLFGLGRRKIRLRHHHVKDHRIHVLSVQHRQRLLAVFRFILPPQTKPKRNPGAADLFSRLTVYHKKSRSSILLDKRRLSCYHRKNREGDRMGSLAANCNLTAESCGDARADGFRVLRLAMPSSPSQPTEAL